MLKLNEKGWGLGFLIFMIVLFISILIGASIGIKKLSKSMKNKKSDSVPLEQTKDYSKMYSLLEDKLKNAGEYFVLDNESVLYSNSSDIKITLDYLKNNGYIDDLLDPVYKDSCSGFIIIKSESDVVPYISCSGYETINYDLWR